MYELLAAACLLMGDGQVLDETERLAPALQRIGVAMELWNTDVVDVESSNWTWQYRVEYARDKLVYWHGSPMTADARNLPPNKLVGEWMDFNEAYIQGLSRRAEFDVLNRPNIEVAISEAEYLRYILCLVWNATNPACSTTTRRDSLWELRNVAPLVYYGAEQPQFVPLHRIPLAGK